MSRRINGSSMLMAEGHLLMSECELIWFGG